MRLMACILLTLESVVVEGRREREKDVPFFSSRHELPLTRFATSASGLTLASWGVGHARASVVQWKVREQ